MKSLLCGNCISHETCKTIDGSPGMAHRSSLRFAVASALLVVALVVLVGRVGRLVVLAVGIDAENIAQKWCRKFMNWIFGNFF